MSDRCARCGRERPPGDRFYEESEGPWASIGGRDVCPQCQTAEEHEAADRDVRAAIKRENERRLVEGIPPDDRERAMIGYTMGSGEPGRGEDRAPADPAPRPEAPERPRPGDSRLRVAITGAFLTGHPLSVRVDTYPQLQRSLGRSLKGPQWQLEDLRERPGTYESGGGFTKPVPLVIARRDGVDLIPWLTDAFDKSGYGPRALRDGTVREFTATPISIGIDVYDLGVAVMTAWLDVTTPKGADLRATARAIKRLVWLRGEDGRRSPVVDRLQQIASQAASAYGEAVVASAPGELQASWLSQAAPEEWAAPPTDGAPDDRGRLLWLHPFHVLHTAEEAEPLAEALTPRFRETIRLEGGFFAAGVGWSAVVASPESDAAEIPMRMTELHWAYYALYMEIDRGLLQVLNQERWSRPAPLRQLEDDANDVFADYLRVMDARSRLDSRLSALGGAEFAIWETIAKAQRFDPIVEGVERKLDVLDKLAKRRVDQASDYRTRRLGEILGALTVLTVVTVAVALIGAFLGSRSNSINSLWVRGSIVGAALVVAIVVYWFAFIRTTRARPMGARPDER